MEEKMVKINLLNSRPHVVKCYSSQPFVIPIKSKLVVACLRVCAGVFSLHSTGMCSSLPSLWSSKSIFFSSLPLIYVYFQCVFACLYIQYPSIRVCFSACMTADLCVDPPPYWNVFLYEICPTYCKVMMFPSSKELQGAERFPLGYTEIIHFLHRRTFRDNPVLLPNVVRAKIALIKLSQSSSVWVYRTDQSNPPWPLGDTETLKIPDSHDISWSHLSPVSGCLFKGSVLYNTHVAKSFP